MNDEQAKIWYQTAAVSFKELALHSPGQTKDQHEDLPG
jgi:hypothetical protein